MLKPEAMQRTLIVSSKGHQAKVIETLHDLRSVHFIDFSAERGAAFEGFRIGSPLPEGAPASAHLVRIRALLRQLGLEGQEPVRALSVRDIEGGLEAQLDAIERQVQAAVATRDSARNTLQEGREVRTKLEPLSGLPLRLEDLRGYDTLTVFVGRADRARLDAELKALREPDHLLVPGGDDVVALFVPNAHAPAFQEALYRAGFSELEVPEGKGTPGERIREIESQRSSLEARERQAEQEVVRLAQQHRDFLLAADEHLGIIVEKAEAPLAFASTENAFVVDAWVPVADVSKVQDALERATAGNLYFQLLETSTAHGHGHGAGPGAHADALFDADQEKSSHADEDAVAPPTKYANPSGVRRFEWFTNLFSTPRYNEIDPTLMFAVFFPLFFGFMIGDLGLGIAMVLLGYLLIKKLPKIDGMKQLGTAFVIAGIVAAALGGLVFKDALGVPLGVTHHMDELVEGEGVSLAGATCATYYTYAHEATWTCLLGLGPVHIEPIVSKVTDINSMLLLSVLAAFIHLLVGLAFGIRNEIGHGAKHVAAKVGYLLLLVTFFPAVVALLRPDMFAGAEVADVAHAAAVSFHLPFTTAQAYMIAGGGFVLGAAILGWAEGFGGVLEIPTIFSAIMSYLRLGAVAIAKGAMAIAFNEMTLVAALTGGSVALVLGIIGFLVAQSVLFVLGMLSGGIQALRLNFVEFFTKFYKGGGKPFKPFGRMRRMTVLDGRPSGGVAEATPVLSTP